MGEEEATHMGTVGLSLLPAGSRRNRLSSREGGVKRKLKKGSIFFLLLYV